MKNIFNILPSSTEVTDGLGNSIPIIQFKNKFTALYFSGNWCPSCRHFTPLLIEKYNEILCEGHIFEIIFVSFDQSEADCASYFKSMPWKMLNYKDRELKQTLSDEFDTNGIPALILFDENGDLITIDGTGIILTVPFNEIKTYEASSQEAAQSLSERMALLPECVTHDSHEHPLYKVYDVYGEGGYGCDICAGGGEMWAYHCEECGFDVHPHCVIAGLKAGLVTGGAGGDSVDEQQEGEEEEEEEECGSDSETDEELMRFLQQQQQKSSSSTVVPEVNQSGPASESEIA